MVKIKINWDALGISASLACAIHCAILPLLLNTLPIFGIEIIKNQAFEWSMILLSFIIGVISLWHGFRKHHHSRTPLILFTIGMLFLIAKQRWHAHGTLLLIPAVLLIVTAHINNQRSCRLHNHAHSDDCDH